MGVTPPWVYRFTWLQCWSASAEAECVYSFFRLFFFTVAVFFCFQQCNSAGRQQIAVDFDGIELLRQLRFSWTKIDEILDISRSTRYRRLESEGLSEFWTYSNISDASLDRHMEFIKQRNPHDGERLLMGHLVALGIIVPRSRLRASIHRIDPVNTELRRRVTVRRRVYFAQGPNSVWHIDGHHKLIRWRFVTHGGIDGYPHTVLMYRRMRAVGVADRRI